MITYENDPLLLEKRIYLGKKEQILNLYSALVKRDDFEVSAKLRSVPYSINNDFKLFLDNLPNKFREKNFFYLRSLHRRYTRNKTMVKPSSFNRWYNTSTFPFSFIRSVSLCFDNDEEILSNFLHSYVTNSFHNKVIRFPKNRKELLNPRLFYLCGCITGDGCIVKDRFVKIVDGHSDEKSICYSKNFLEKLNNLFYDIFCHKSKKIRRKGNMYEILIVSKWTVRFLDFFFELPHPPKKDIKYPKIIPRNNRFYLMGLFDTDGGLHKDSKFIVFKSACVEFTKDIREMINRLGMSPGELKEDRNGIGYFSLYAHDIREFSNKVGFNHPRKKNVLLKHLRKGASDKMFLGINNRIIYKNYLDIFQIRDLRILGIGKIINNLRRKEGLSQKEFARKLGVKRRNLGRYENNVLAVPISIISKLGIDKHNLFESMEELKPLYGIGGHNFIRFPINLDKIKEYIFHYLSPQKDSVLVRKRYKGFIIENKKLEIIISDIERYFGVKVYKHTGKSNDCIVLSKTLSILIDNFFHYSVPWKALNKSEIDNVKSEMSI